MASIIEFHLSSISQPKLVQVRRFLQSNRSSTSFNRQLFFFFTLVLTIFWPIFFLPLHVYSIIHHQPPYWIPRGAEIECSIPRFFKYFFFTLSLLDLMTRNTSHFTLDWKCIQQLFFLPSWEAKKKMVVSPGNDFNKKKEIKYRYPNSFKKDWNANVGYKFSFLSVFWNKRSRALYFSGGRGVRKNLQGRNQCSSSQRFLGLPVTFACSGWWAEKKNTGLEYKPPRLGKWTLHTHKKRFPTKRGAQSCRREEGGLIDERLGVKRDGGCFIRRRRK